jgi:hypothetical protein
MFVDFKAAYDNTDKVGILGLSRNFMSPENVDV